jgi:hypothetical protein
MTLSLTGVDFGDESADDWKSIGFNLDGKCTTSTSTDVCELTTGASLSTQDDGTGGIDNSYGENLCPIFETLSNDNPCSSGIAQAFLQTDASGTGNLVLGSLVFPVRDVHISVNAGAGMAGGVIPTAGLATAVQNWGACISTSLCSGSAIESVVSQFEQASDIASNGINAPGTTCDGISFGLTFTGSTPVTSIPSAPNCPCP